MGERADEMRDPYSPEPDPYRPLSQTDSFSGVDQSVTPQYDLAWSDSATDDNTEAETEAIREDIEQTRANMARTVDEIQDRLSPQNIMEQVKETASEKAGEAIDNVKQTVHDATVGKVENMVNNVSDTARETGSGIMDLIKENPVPAALAGLGLGWLFMKRQNQSGNQAGYNKSNITMGYPVPGAYAASYPYNPTAIPMSYTQGVNYSSSSGKAGGNGGLVDKILQNPVPAAVAGLSIGYIFMKGQDRNTTARTGYSGAYYGYGSQGSQQGLGQVKDKVGEVANQAGQKVGDLAGSAGDAVGQAGQKVGDIASGTAGAVGDIASGTAGAVGDITSGAAEKVGDIASGAGDVAGNVVGGVQQGAQQATTQLERMFRENPLAVGGVALAIGAVIGMMLPATQKENEILGKAHDNLMEKAGEAVQQTMDKVGNVAEQVTDTAKEEAKNQGLTQ
jgi:ElaB/YqjD/DUF883 family membrane-anchored ribosome-binding protein